MRLDTTPRDSEPGTRLEASETIRHSQTKGPLVTVVMGVYNGERYLAEAVESILGQTLQDFEIIVVDDGSTDRTGAILDSYDDPRLLVARQHNEGLAAALQKGLGMTTGEFFARQDADDVSEPTRLKRQVDFLRLNPGVVGLGTGCMEIGEDGREMGVKRLPVDDRGCKEALAVASPIGHGSAMIRAEVLRQAGGYRIEFRLGQDRDMWLRLSERGKLANLPERLYSWRRNPQSLSALERGEQRKATRRALAMAVSRLHKGIDELGERVAPASDKRTLARHRFYLGLGLFRHLHLLTGLRLMLGAQLRDVGELGRWYSLLVRAPLGVLITIMYRAWRRMTGGAQARS